MSVLRGFLESIGAPESKENQTFYDLLKRPEVRYDYLESIDSDRPELTRNEITEIEVEIKYSGYISKQQSSVKKMRQLENKSIPADINYDDIRGLRLEAVEKLKSIEPNTVGRASRISGVNPADINVLLVYLEKMNRLNRRQNHDRSEEN